MYFGKYTLLGNNNNDLYRSCGLNPSAKVKVSGSTRVNAT